MCSVAVMLHLKAELHLTSSDSNTQTKRATLQSSKLAILWEEVAVHLQLLLMQAMEQHLIPSHQAVTNISNIQAHCQLYFAIPSLPVCICTLTSTQVLLLALNSSGRWWNEISCSSQLLLLLESICLSRANHCSGVHVMTSSEQAEITHTADHFITSEWLFIYLSAAETRRDKACHSWANSPYSLRRWSGMWGS